MSEPLLDRVKKLPQKLMKLLKLQKIDQHDSLTFLYKNYKIHPSELITAIVALIALIVMVLDGCNIIASFVCFILPLAGCLKELAVSEEKRRLNFVKINASDQNSRLTDEQFSQIESSSKKHHSTINIHIVYFISYSILEALSPLVLWIIGSFSWLVIRCLFTMAMLSKKLAGASKLIDLLQLKPAHLSAQVQASERRNANLLIRK